MKKLTIAFLLLTSVLSNAQTTSLLFTPYTGTLSGTISGGNITLGSPLFGDSPTEKQEVITTYDTVLVFKGTDTAEHEHDYVRKSIAHGMYSGGNISCAVYHGITGCPDKWMYDDVICTICLRDFTVQESRSIKVTKIIDKYQEAKDRLKEIQK